SSTSSGLVVNIDNNLPTIIGGDVQAANVTGGTASRMEANDTLTLKFAEQMDPDSILSTWTGASLSVTIRVINSGNADTIQIWNSANTTQAALGTVTTNGNFVSGNVNFTSSTMVQSAGTLTITLGTPNTPANLRTVGSNTTM